MADLDLNIKSKADQEDLVDSLMKPLKIKSAGRDNFYTLGYRDPEPEKAKRVVQSLVSIFVESSLGISARIRLRPAVHRRTDQGLREEARRGRGSLKEFKLRNLDLARAKARGMVERISPNQRNLARLVWNFARQRTRATRSSATLWRRAGLAARMRRETDRPGFPEIDGRIERSSAISMPYCSGSPNSTLMLSALAG